MSILLRTLLFLSFGGIFLVADLLCAQAPPLPVPPRPNANTAQLEALRNGMSGSGITQPQVAFAGATTSQSFQSAHEDVRFPEQFPPPKPISQTSFATTPLPTPAMSEGLIHEKLPEDSYYDYHEEYEPIDLHHAMLDRPLSSRRSAMEFEDEESDTGGWGNKLIKPDITPLMSIGGSLLIVIAAFFLLAILLRKVSPQSNRPLPKDAFECLGRYYLTQKHQVQLLRLGSRIVLVSVMPDGVSTLAEITDPDEAVSLLGLCRRLDTNSATEMFRKTVASMSEEELSRPYQRPVTISRRQQPAASFDVYSEPDESLAAILARGRQYGR